jgi:hypothetical protein
LSNQQWCHHGVWQQAWRRNHRRKWHPGSKRQWRCRQPRTWIRWRQQRPSHQEQLHELHPF